ncbi:nitrile hydratase accessory protein [Pseudomonas syringae]|nr:nitrile hydratase accessory protein [Pseudomonas syringae]EGH71498.1 hypothetical protein PSYAR_13164 [Pseudomonas syringae pv. aceris str. M302273]
MDTIKALIDLVEREDPVFEEPWQADSFIMAVALSHSGAFTWPEWVSHFAATIRNFPQQEGEATGTAYYRQWLRCFEEMLGDRGLIATEDLKTRIASWRTAYELTPHGSPVELAFAQSKALEANHDHDHDGHHDHEHHHHDHEHHHHGLFSDDCAVSSGQQPVLVKPISVFPGRVSVPN